MNKGLIKLVLLTFLIGVGVALTYFLFEWAVRVSIDVIWDDLFNTDSRRWLVVPLCISLTLVYFGLRHRLDPASEKHAGKELGEMPEPTISNFWKTLFIGFFSLIAGASLGPEAILIPACLIVGSYAGLKFIGNNKKIVGLFGIIGFVALIAAFFNSFIVGMLSLILVKKQFKAPINARVILLSAIACAGTVLALHFLEGSAYVDLPKYTWSLDFSTVHFLLLLLAAGYLTTYVLGFICRNYLKAIGTLDISKWWMLGLIAGVVLSVIYLLGGTMVQFTGNESIKPMFQEAANLGVLGLLWILLIKLLAIGWSKTIGYRGGLVFPSIFVASVLVAIAQTYDSNLNLIYGLISTMFGMLWADGKVKVLL